VGLTRISSLKQVAIAVGSALRKHGVHGVLTGGACANVYTKGGYVSGDVDVVLGGRVTQATLDEVMDSVGFKRSGDRYMHPGVDYFVDFPPGPLAIGSDVMIRPVTIKSGADAALGLSATDSCRDRLAGYFYWKDRQSFETAVQIAMVNRVNLDVIRAWSKKEGRLDSFEEFLSELDRRRAVAKRRRSSRRKRTAS
jgi:hypothetical protein